MSTDNIATSNAPEPAQSRPTQLVVNAAAPTSSVSFPTSTEVAEQSPRGVVPPRPFLPFRRISLPANSEAPFYKHRDSVVSLKSFDSLAEEPRPQGSAATPTTPTTPSRKPRPTSLQPPPRAKQRAESRRRRTEIISSHDKEGKRRSIVAEILETERTYVEGLDLIYDLFLLPLIASLDGVSPILTRTELNSIFVNFVDIWNFHRSFLDALQGLVNTNSNPPLAPLLSEHFPYLSLYTPFITAFPDSVSAITSLTTSNPAFSTFLKTQQNNPRCKLLSLRDWLLSIVQRCPRYLLLLKDLISCTEPLNDEYEGLCAVHTLVSKITSALNTSLHSHTQTLQLLAIQKSTPNLPFPLISPGRTLLRRGTLLKVDMEQRLREFILLSDVLIWLSKANEREWEWSSRPTKSAALNPSASANLIPTRPSPLAKSSISSIVPSRPSLGPRTRSKSDAELPTWGTSSLSGDEKWTYRGKIDLMDIEIVVSTLPGPGEGRKFDIFGPTESFAVYTSTTEERNGWVQAIRSAKASLLMTLNITQGESTLTSSSSNAHLRRSLQALPHIPDPSPSGKPGKRVQKRERRRIVEHFIPPPWVPDAKAESCMRCGRLFGLLRRRHHCRLCGRVVCGDCSTKTFFISDPDAPDQAKAARSCNMCYESIFPVLPPSPTIKSRPLSTPSSPTSSSFPQNRPSVMHVPTLPDIPSHRSLAEHGSPQSEIQEGVIIPPLPPPSPEALSDGLPISSSLPNHLPTSTSLIPVPTRQALFGDPRQRTSLPSMAPSTSENMAKFQLPTPLYPPSSFTSRPFNTGLSSSSDIFAPSGESRSKSPDPGRGVASPRRSRASLPAVRDSFYANDSHGITSEDINEAMNTGTNDLQPDVESATPTDNGVQKRHRRITFAPSSEAVHTAPVTIYPQTDDLKRFSLVLTGKGTIGRGAGLDIGEGEHEGGEEPFAPALEQTTSAPALVPSSSTASPRSRRMVFDGLERGIAAGRLNWLLRRDGKGRKTSKTSPS